ncbi:MAG: hypothetical protein JO240_14990, partial [Solirubrobacterales bacterium]|nr:hypothetical protein [Solirubrobacterales bacterium]
NKVGLGALIDGSQANFDALKTRLDEISSQLTDLQRALQTINGELKQIALNQYTGPLEDYVTAIKNLYDLHFSPAVDAANNFVQKDRAAIADGKPCDQVTTCAEALKAFTNHRDDFWKAESEVSNEALNDDIHTKLMPDSSGNSALIVFGDFLMGGRGSTGLLTSADSDRLFAFYDYFSEYEALAVWMKAEYLAHFFSDLPNPEEKLRAFVDKQIRGYFDLEHRELPARIPQETVISLPPQSTDRTITKGQHLWLWNFKLGLDAQWDPSASPDHPFTVPAGITALNTTAAGLGFTDWRVPSKGDWDSLFAGRVPSNSTTRARFWLDDNVLPNVGNSNKTILAAALDQHPHVWTSQPPIPDRVGCLRKGSPLYIGYVTDYAHTGLSLPLTALLANYPAKFPLATIPNIGISEVRAPTSNSADALKYCRDTVAAAVTKAFGPTGTNITSVRHGAQLIATRLTTVNYMPVDVPVP